MLRRRAPRTTLLTALLTLLLTGLLTAPALPSYAAGPPTAWRLVASDWASTSFTFEQSYAVGDRAVVVGEADLGAPDYHTQPFVQTCLPSGCVRTELPLQTGEDYTQIQALTGASADDVWALGFSDTSQLGPIHAVAWHYDGTSWTRVVEAGLTALETVSRATETAAGDLWAVAYQATDGPAESGIVHRAPDGTWTQIPSSDLPSPCTTGTGSGGGWNSIDLDAGAPVVLGVCAGVETMLEHRAGQWVHVDAGLPANSEQGQLLHFRGRLTIAAKVDQTAVFKQLHGSYWKTLPLTGLADSPYLGQYAGHFHTLVAITGGQVNLRVFGDRWVARAQLPEEPLRYDLQRIMVSDTGRIWTFGSDQSSQGDASQGYLFTCF